MGKQDVTGEIAKVSLVGGICTGLQVRHGQVIFMLKVLAFSWAVLKSENFELMNLKVHVYKECFIYNITYEIKIRLSSCRACDLLLQH